MTTRFIFVTGTDTGVGKTVLAALLTHRLRQRGLRVAGLKPICSGGRADARVLREATGKVLSLDEVNPWHFRAPIAPLLAARKERQAVRLREVVKHIRRVAQNLDFVIVEGAGGLLSPLGEDFDSRDLIRALGAAAVVVCPNRLGAVNQSLLVLEALPRPTALRAAVVLMAEANANPAAKTNSALLAEKIGLQRVHELPRLGRPSQGTSLRIRLVLDRLVLDSG